MEEEEEKEEENSLYVNNDKSLKSNSNSDEIEKENS